jgi:ribonuclease P protein component
MNRMIEDHRHEAHLSAQQNQTRSNPWVPKKNVHQTRPAYYQPEKGKGSQATRAIKTGFGLSDGKGVTVSGVGQRGHFRPGSPTRPSATFQKKDRILKRRQFQRLSAVGTRIHSPHFIAVFQPTKVGFSRLGVTVTKRVGGAVTRNRIRRLVREFFRLNRESLRGSYDLNLIAKKEASGSTAGETFATLEHLFKNIASRRLR